MDPALDPLDEDVAGPAPRESREPRARRLEVVNGKVLNPRTGKMVNSDGRVGRALAAEHRRALEREGVVLPRGNLRGPAPPRAQPGLVERDDAFVAQRRGLQRAGAFRLQRWEAPQTGSVATFARTIAKVLEGVPVAQQRHVNIDFLDADGNRITRAVHGRTPAELADSIDRIQGRGESVAGSDTIDAGFALDTSSFAVGSVHAPGGGALQFRGISKGAGTRHPHFRIIDFSKKAAPGDCLFAVLRAVAATLGLKPAAGWPQNGTIRRELGLPAGNIVADTPTIELVADYFRLRVRVITGTAVPPDDEREFDDNPARAVGRNRCDTTAEPVVIAEGGPVDAPPCDVYLADEHYEYIAEHLRVATCPVTGDILPDGLPLAAAKVAARVVDQGRPYYAEGAPAACEAIAEVSRTTYRDHIIVYDYETVYRADDGTLEPYALGFIIFDPASETADFSEAAGRVTQVLRREGDSRYAVTDPLIDALCRAPPDVRYTLVSFNGARFDHFLLAQGANNRGLLTSVFATAAGGLRDVRIGRHRTLDLAKLCPAMSLLSACDGFKTRPRKVEGFDHREVQTAYEAGGLYTWMHDNRVKLAEYLAGDVLSESSLFISLTRALTASSGAPCYGDKAVGTIGGHAWELMNTTCELPAAVANESLDRHIRSAIVGGRVEVYGDKRPRIELEPAYMVDFASLYPTVMAAVPEAAALFESGDGWGLYPDANGARAAGEAAAAALADATPARKRKAAAAAVKAFKAAAGRPTEVDEYRPGVPGVYRVTIHEQAPGLPNLVPRRGDTLEWDYRGEFDTVISHVTIALLRRHGGRVTVHGGHVWEKATVGLFEPFVTPLAAQKDEQDRLDPADPKYNPALRMATKLLMNAGSGKCCQANYDDVVVLAKGSAAQLAAERKMKAGAPTTWIPLGGETCIIVGKKLDSKVYTERAKPSILAVLIYEYSRALVWRTLCQHNCLYSDTDSGLFARADYEALRAAFPAIDPTGRVKRLGDLEQELKPHARAVCFRMAPKDYAVYLYGEDGKLLPGKQNARGEMTYPHKIRMKGVNQRTDRLLVKGGGDLLRGRPMSELASEYNASCLELSKPLSDPEVSLQFYERRAAGETVDVLCGQLMRGTLSLDRPLELYQRFIIKSLAGADHA